MTCCSIQCMLMPSHQLASHANPGTRHLLGHPTSLPVGAARLCPTPGQRARCEVIGGSARGSVPTPHLPVRVWLPVSSGLALRQQTSRQVDSDMKPRGSAWGYVLCYALWGVTVALGLLNAAVIRMWVREGYVRAGLDPWGLAAVDQTAMIVLVLTLLGATITLEYYFRGGLANGTLWARFRRSAIALAIVPLLRLIETLLT